MKLILNYNTFINIRLIKEASFFDYNTSNILTNEYVKKWIEEEDMTSIYLDNFIDKYNIDDSTPEFNWYTIINSLEFIEYVKKDLKRHLQETIKNIDTHINNGKITLWRVIRVDDKWLKHLEYNGKHLGIYWSWDKYAAEAHWGKYENTYEVIIEVEVDEKLVNWKETIYMNMHPNYSEEREIRLFKNTPIIIKSIEYDGDKIDVEFFKNKIFLA